MDQPVCRTATATPGLLKIYHNLVIVKSKLKMSINMFCWIDTLTKINFFTNSIKWHICDRRHTEFCAQFYWVVWQPWYSRYSLHWGASDHHKASPLMFGYGSQRMVWWKALPFITYASETRLSDLIVGHNIFMKQIGSIVIHRIGPLDRFGLVVTMSV